MTLIPEKRRSTLFEQVFLKVTELKNIKFFSSSPNIQIPTLQIFCFDE